MLGLRDYGSDDEQERSLSRMKENGTKGKDIEQFIRREDSIPISGSFRDSELVLGPAPGPLLLPQSVSDGEDSTSSPASPYTAARQVIHNLTLPPVPNVVIPLSPPHSPDPISSEKIVRFLELKSKGVHFNAKVLSSSQLRNPSLLQNLMSFAGIDEEQGQYASTLSVDLAPVPENGFPKWAYEEKLAKAQQETLKKNEAEKARWRREAVDFVAASSGPSSQASTPQGGTRTGVKWSAAERVMAGLDREKSRSPRISNDGGQRRSRFDEKHQRRRSRSRSPKRRKDN